MEALILILYWLTFGIWCGVTWFYARKTLRTRSSSIRSLRTEIAVVVVVLTAYMAFNAVTHTTAFRYWPEFGMRMEYIEGVVNVLMFAAGAVLLILKSRRFDQVAQQVAVSGLQARYRYMIESDPRAIMLFSMDRKLIEINRQGSEWVKNDHPDPVGKTLLELLSTLQPENPEELVERIRQREQVEFKRGDYIFGDFEWTALKDESGQKVGYMLCFRDVTEEKKFQREIIHSEKLAVVGQLAAATAHEIRNPLTSIKGFLQLMGHRVKGSQHEGEIREYTRIMVEEVDRMEKIIRDFLLMTKPSDAIRERVNINDLLERMLILVQNQATLRNINVITDLQSDAKVLMHREGIQQVALNLLQNAFEAMNTGGTLTLRTSEDDQYVSIEVIDTGIGMTEEEMVNLGSPFYSTKTEGTGLGLTVSSKIIKEHGGKLDIQSKKGAGTTITVRLPK